MPCYHPNKVFLLPPDGSGKDSYKFSGFDAEYIYPVGSSWVPSAGFPRPLGARSEHKVVRCGQCIDCRLARARSMAERGLLEMKMHKQSMFLTLTYSPENVPLSYPDGSNPYEFVMTLAPVDFTNFMKRLRKAFSPTRLRLMACGEYGDTTMRPHYHAIVFGLDPTDLNFFTRTELGDNLYTSDIITRIWGLGYVVLGEVTYESLGYVSRYLLKKQTGLNSDVYDKLGVIPPFSRYSNRPGIGGLYLENYYDDFVDSLQLPDIINISTKKGGKAVHFPRYFLDRLEVDLPDEVARIKDLRLLNAQANVELIERELQIPYKDYLLQLERSHKARVKGLIRKL